MFIQFAWKQNKWFTPYLLLDDLFLTALSRAEHNGGRPDSSCKLSSLLVIFSSCKQQETTLEWRTSTCNMHKWYEWSRWSLSVKLFTTECNNYASSCQQKHKNNRRVWGGFGVCFDRVYSTRSSILLSDPGVSYLILMLGNKVNNIWDNLQTLVCLYFSEFSLRTFTNSCLLLNKTKCINLTLET